MYMKKNYILFAATLMALASCQTDDYLGNNQGNAEGTTEGAIRFDGNSGKVTRTEGEAAATALNKKFVVFGYKTTGTGSTKQTVYNYYNVNWLGTDKKSESNQKGWEYVGQEKNTLNKQTGGQTIKYWDYTASQYDFVAFSFGKATQGTEDDQVTASDVTNTSTPTYSLTGKVSELAKCYIADLVTAKKSATEQDKKANLIIGYQDNVQFNFRSLSTKVKMGIYETIPGYSVKDVVFYSDDNTKLSGDNNLPTLYSKSKSIPADKGKMVVSFGTGTTDLNQATVQWTAQGTDKSTVDFKALELTNKESAETDSKIYLGRTSVNASKPSEYQTVLPGSTIGELTLKVDYTLVSTDGSNEEIKVTGATATIPAAYTQWKPNYAYTYIFKISDKTNGSTGGDKDPKGLYPIVFDAIVTETETGKQETITEIDDASITTYSKGAIGNEYVGGSNIYVTAKDATLHIKNTANTEDTTPTNCALYTVTTTGNVEPTEALVKLCLEKGTKNQTNNSSTLTIAEGKTITVTAASGLSIVNEIAASDAVDGNAINGNFAKFTASDNATTYVFEYTKDSSNKYYKVIKVVAKSEN